MIFGVAPENSCENLQPSSDHQRTINFIWHPCLFKIHSIDLRQMKETGGMDMVILRFLLKLLTLPLLLIVDIALLITKASLWLSEVVVGLGIWICIIVGLFCLFDGLYPCAIAFGVMLLIIFIGLFAACVIEYFFESVRGALKRI